MSQRINIAILADAGAELGTGHFGRAGAVVHALSVYENLDITLVTTQSGEAHVSRYFSDTVDCYVLPSQNSTPAEIMKTLRDRGTRPDVIYMDQYGSVPMWEILCKSIDLPLVVIDDLDEAQDATIIFKSLVNDQPSGSLITGMLYEGPAYLPLTRHIASQKMSGEAPQASSLRMNVCFGGSDPTNETIKTLMAIAQIDDIIFDVVIGPGALITADELAPFKDLPQITLHYAPSQEQLSDLLCEADFALGAGGVMQWERLCLGVPSLVITVAENQLPQINWMKDNGLLQLIGDHTTATPNMIRQCVETFRDAHALRAKIRKKGKAVVDGRGAIRIAAAIRSLSLSARRVHIDDALNILDWRTHERNWQFNFSTADKPSYDFHVDWLTEKLADPDCMYIIIEQGDIPISVVRFDITPSGDAARLSIYLVPDQHGKKLGLAVYMAAEHALRNAYSLVNEVHSHIHVTNYASQRLHTDAGFTLSKSDENAIMLNTTRCFNET
jgi:spore coat polysaccharide biosynthesis predicted glycosyltransferase SpsG/RimJ/RimL family protein N-acetyltransferase